MGPLMVEERLRTALLQSIIVSESCIRKTQGSDRPEMLEWMLLKENLCISLSKHAMKILICTNSLGAFGGLERVTIVKANALAKMPGNEVMVCFTDKGTFPERTIHPLSPQVRVVDLGVSFWDLHPINLKNMLITAPRKFYALRRALKKVIAEFSPDVIVTTGSYEKFALASINPSRIVARPAVKIREYHFNSNYRIYIMSRTASKILGWLDNDVLSRRFDMNYLLTRANKEAFFNRRENFDYQYNPCSFAPKDPVPDMDDRSNSLIAVNRPDRLKNTEGLLKIWSLIADKAGDWRLNVIGIEGQYNGLGGKVKDMHLDNSVRCLGFRKDVEDLLLDSRILVMTSISEGMPMAMLEAMGCGVVPVSYRTPFGPSDIITDGVDGVLVDYMDEKQFAEKLLALINDPGRLQRMSAAAVRRSRDFDVDKIAGEWMQKYEGLLDKKKKGKKS